MIDKIIGGLKDPVVMILVIILLIIIVVVTYVVKSVSPVMPYLYLSAIIQSRSKKMLSRSKVKQLSEAKNNKELMSLLSDTHYAKESTEKETLNELHRHFEGSFFKVLNEVQDLSPRQMKSFLDAYLMFYEASIIKMLYKVKKTDQEYDSSLLYPVGSIKKDRLTRLIESDSIEEFIGAFYGSEYHSVISKEYEKIEDFDNALDNYVVKAFSEKLSKIKIEDKKLIQKLIDMLMDVKNIKLKMQSVIRGKEIKLVDAGTLDLKELDNAKDIESIVEYLKKTQYHESAEIAYKRYKENNSMSGFGLEIERHMVRFIENNLMLHPQGAFNVFSYVLLNEIEKNNLYKISKGIQAGFKSSKIMEMIV